MPARALVVVALAAVVVAICVEPKPSPLPGIALGSPVLLAAERAAVMAAAVLGVGGVMLELFRGRRVASVGGGPMPALDLEPAAEAEPLTVRLGSMDDRLQAVERRLRSSGCTDGENG